jgi:hypothetical protein
LKRVIQALRREVEELIRPYEELARSNVGAKEALEWPEVLSSLELRANQLNLLHRLVLVMIFREGYVVRACGLMLGCRDSVVQILQDEGLTRLS